MTLAEPLKVVVRTGQLFDRLGVRWVVVGGLASALHGDARSVSDADLVAELSAEHVPSVIDDLARGFFVERQRVIDAVLHRTGFTAVHVETMTRVDVYVGRGDRRAKAQLDRRVMFRIFTPEETLPVLSIEDAALGALDWHGRGGSRAAQAWSDAVGVLRAGGVTLNRGYLRREAKRSGLLALLDAASAEARGRAPPSGRGSP